MDDADCDSSALLLHMIISYTFELLLRGEGDDDAVEDTHEEGSVGDPLYWEEGSMGDPVYWGE